MCHHLFLVILSISVVTNIFYHSQIHFDSYLTKSEPHSKVTKSKIIYVCPYLLLSNYSLGSHSFSRQGNDNACRILLAYRIFF